MGWELNLKGRGRGLPSLVCATLFPGACGRVNSPGGLDPILGS